jgi:putative ABC transport system permease protein
VAVLHFPVHIPGLHGLNVIGVVPDSTGAPKARNGRDLSGSGQVVLDSSLGLHVGDRLRIGKGDFRVVGETSGVTYYAGQPVAFVPLADAQRLAFLGQPLASAIVTEGVPAAVPAGYRVLSDADVKDDLLRPLGNASKTIDLLRVLLWLVAAGIIGSIVYLQAIERTPDFAVMKATGTTNRALMGGLALQAVVLSALAAILAVVLAQLLKPLVAVSVEIPWSAYVLLPIVAVIVGFLASFAGLRRAVTIDPALAFGA